MTTTQQDRDFIETIAPDRLSWLENAIDFISKRLEPQDVFTEQRLKEWAIDNGYVEKDDV